MISGGTRKFDLYDFFSVLVPGLTFVFVGIVPFLPNSFSIGSIQALLPLLVAGFVVGRGIHVIAAEIEEEYESKPTHRERFRKEITDPTMFEEETIDRFKEGFSETFDVEISSQDDTYGIIRSYIHIDGRGRSRTFQALYSFYRSMWIVSVILAIVFYIYAILRSGEVLTQSNIYLSHIGTIEISPVVIALASAAILLVGGRVFESAREDYQEHFVRYMIADFLVLQAAEEEPSVTFE